MGGDRLDERVFASVERVVTHGGDQWWLDLSTCTACGQNWMVAADQRIYDNYYLRRLTSGGRATIEAGQWPDEFLTYENVLRLGRTMSSPWAWRDPRSPSLVDTAHDLRRERPDITIGEIADLLGIPLRQAVRLLEPPSWIDRLRAWATRGS